MRLKTPNSIPPLALALAAACAGAPVRPEADPHAREIAELQGQLKAQSALVAEQQQRIEQLELRVAGLNSKLTEAEKRKPAPAAAVDPGTTPETISSEPTANPVIEYDAARDPAARAIKPPKGDPRNKLQTVKLQPAKGRRLRRNPVDRAPRLDTGTDLKEPAEADLRELAAAAEPGARKDSSTDALFAHAVARLNEGDRAGAQQELLLFARRHPLHAAADNAVYLAGLAQAQSGDCEGALPLFGRVQVEYPAGDAVPSARLEAARCLIKLGRNGEARQTLAALEKDYPDVPEASQARALLNGL